MGLRDFFNSKKSNSGFDPLTDLVLAKLRPGYLVDYAGHTWQVTGYSRNDFGEGYLSEEWELNSGSETRWLEREDLQREVVWYWSQRLPLGELDTGIRQHIRQHEDPPDTLTFADKEYYLEESGPGYCYEHGREPAQEFIYWSYVNEQDDTVVTVEQWSETEFAAWLSQPVHEYEFTNILPGADTSLS